MAPALVGEFSKRFPTGTTVTAALRLEPASAPVSVLFGPSGAGKTTVLRCLAGLERPDRGQVCYGDEVWFDAARGICLPPQRRRAGYLFQDYALFPHLTVARNVAFGCRRARAARRARAGDLLEQLAVADLAARYPAELSGGQRQRVALARALASDPAALLLDEPLSALDAPAREPLRRELRRVLAACGIPTLLVTHDRTEALALGDRMMVIVDGRVRQTGPVPEVFSRPADLTVARAVGVETVAAGRVVASGDGLVTVAVGATRLVASDPGEVTEEVLVCIRAEDVLLERGAPARSSARNHLDGRVEALTPEGPSMRVTVGCGLALAALVTRAACEDLGLVTGAPVTAVVKATAVHLIRRDR